MRNFPYTYSRQSEHMAAQTDKQIIQRQAELAYYIH